MREKIILDHRIDGTPAEIEEIISLFIFENLDFPDAHFKIETENQKQLWVVYRPGESVQPNNKVIIGYIDIYPLSIFYKKPVKIRLVSCAEEFDLLFFLLSQRIQAKFIVTGYPPELLSTSWKELAAKGLLKPLLTTMETTLLERLNNPKGKIGEYGRDRDISGDEVKEIVNECRAYMGRDGTAKDYYETILRSDIREKCNFETFRGWLKRFNKSRNSPQSNH
jgi:hypothetical protein